MYIVISTCMNFSNLECHGIIGNSAWGQDDRKYLRYNTDSYAFLRFWYTYLQALVPEILAISAAVNYIDISKTIMINDGEHGAAILHVWSLFSYLEHC